MYYNKPLILTCLDYEKLYYSAEQEQIIAELADCRVEHRLTV